MPHESQTIWDIETRFWRGEEAFFNTHMASHVLMVFPDPVGILDHEAILSTLAAEPRWRHVEMEARHAEAPHRDILFIAYKVEAWRGGEEEPYRAWCSSSYICQDHDWQLFHHQQTPIMPVSPDRAGTYSVSSRAVIRVPSEMPGPG